VQASLLPGQVYDASFVVQRRRHEPTNRAERRRFNDQLPDDAAKIIAAASPIEVGVSFCRNDHE